MVISDTLSHLPNPLATGPVDLDTRIDISLDLINFSDGKKRYSKLRHANGPH